MREAIWITMILVWLTWLGAMAYLRPGIGALGLTLAGLAAFSLTLVWLLELRRTYHRRQVRRMAENHLRRLSQNRQHLPHQNGHREALRR